MGLFSDYEIEELIAEGGMTTLYRCRQTASSRPVAVKVLSQRLMTRHPEIVEYFNSESPIITRLRHPNIVRVIDSGISGGLPYFVMEYVDGSPLDRLLAQDSFGFAGKLDIAVQIAKALTYAHRNGVIHGDLKPANVLIGRDGRVRIVNFGIAGVLDAGRGDDLPDTDTADYGSPERRAGGVRLMPAADIYSFGVILYEMLTGHLPSARLRLPSSYDPAIPSNLDALIATCLEPDAAKRFPDGAALAQRLLETLWGAHLGEAQKQKALEGVGDITTRFAVLDVIRESPSGAVYLCENTVNHRKVVVKKIPNARCDLAHAQAVMRLGHPNIARTFGISGDNELSVVVSEYLPGGSLADRLVNPWPWKEGLGLARAIADALVVTHRLGIVHGDLRPSNILFAEDGTPRLTDYCLDGHDGDDAAGPNRYRYGSEPRGVAADIFALGAVMYETIVGSPPRWQRNELAVDERFRALPIEFQNMLRRMLAPVPKDRYRGVDELVGVMDALADAGRARSSPPRNTPRRTTIVLLLMLVVAAGIALWYRPELLAAWFDRWFAHLR